MKNANLLPSRKEFLTQERLYPLDFSNDERKVNFSNENNQIFKLAQRSWQQRQRYIYYNEKICDKSLVKPLIILFQNYFKWS